MDLDAAREFIRTTHRAVLGTRRRDGGVQLTPVIAGVDDTGLVVVSTRETAFKVRNLRRDPRVWLCVLPEAFFGPWIQAEGTARILSLPDALGPLVDYYRRISGEHPDWDDYRSAMVRERRCLVRIELTRAGPDRYG